jgi:hypothetical protein
MVALLPLLCRTGLWVDAQVTLCMYPGPGLTGSLVDLPACAISSDVSLYDQAFNQLLASRQGFANVVALKLHGTTIGEVT